MTLLDTPKNPHQYQFRWIGYSRFGKIIKGELFAKDSLAVKIQLHSQFITPIKIRKKILFLNQKITGLDIAILFRQLSTLISAGIPIVQACQSLENSANKLSFKLLITSIKKNLENGQYLSHELSKLPYYFDSFACHLIYVGEKTGRLDQALVRVANYKENAIKLKKQLFQALLYPFTVSLIALIVTLIMLVCIVPRFAELFQSQQQQLPLLTRFILLLSSVIRDYYWILLIPTFISLFFIYYFYSKKNFKSKLDAISLKLPFINKIISQVMVIRILRTLSTTTSSGINLLDSIKILSQCTTHSVYVSAIRQMQLEIERGMQLHFALQSNPLFPSLVVQMIKVGEESGMLEAMLDKSAVIYEQNLDHLIVTIKLILEPLIMIILGVLIGGLVIAMYLPIFKIGTVI